MRMSGKQPRTLAEDLRARSDDELAALLTARPDLLHPIPSDMRALTTRAATAPSIARYLDEVDAVHHFALMVACELSVDTPTSIDAIVKTVIARTDTKARTAVKQAVEQLWIAALLWGTRDKVHVITAVRDQVANTPVPHWPPPSCDTKSAMSDKDIDGRAALHARSMLSTIEEVGDLWRRNPGAVLRTGGLSTRAADALANTLDVDRFDLTCAIDTARAAGLFGIGPTTEDLGWMPTEQFEKWREATPERRWARLIQAWMNTSSISTDKPLAPEEHPFIAPWRRQLLTAVESVSGECDLATALDIIDFRWPRRAGKARSSTIATLWREAEVLGVLSTGRLSAIGRCVIENDDVTAMAASVKGLLVDEIDHVLVQADHTIVAPGPITPSVGRRLREIADVESRGHATVLRISSASVHRAMETETDPNAWIDFLASISTKELPQPVAYVISDAARSQKQAKARFTAPPEPGVRRRPRVRATQATIDKAIRVLRAHETRESISPADTSVDVPKMDSASVVAQLRYSIDHNETVHLTHVESDGSVALLLVDPIRLGGGSLTAYDHGAEQVRTFAVSRINGIASLQISA